MKMSRGKNKILLVDDEPVNIQLLKGALSGDYEIFSSLNGFNAIDQIKSLMPDLILLDVMMPEMNGFDVCRVLKSDEACSAIPVIFLTAMDTIDGEAQGLGAGGIDFLTKPVNLNLLKLRIRNHLELKHRNDVIREQRDLLARQKEELEAACGRIKRLEGIIPICMHCKSIRIDRDSWQRLEQYITEHSDALFSHGICPDCIAKYYPEIVEHL
jgi:DNA-binding response OmpR family regulator